MVKQMQNFTQLFVRLLVYVVAAIALFFSSCKRKEMPEIKPTYMVTFDSKDGTAVSAIAVKQGDSITLPEPPSKADFTFGGWYTDSRANTSPFLASTAITANLTLYAKWEVKPFYTVIFDSKDGTAISAIAVKQGDNLTLPANPTKTCFTFDGWYTDSGASTNPFSASTAITADITLYAKWKINPFYTVIFDSKDGTAVNSIRVKQGDNLILPANPTKTGFTFGGWYTDSEANASPFLASTAITTNLTLYAKWNVFSLSSTSFTDGGEIPPKYAYQDRGQADRFNVSPQLSWANAPAGTTSFLILLEDKDQQCNNYWRAFNIPAGITSLAEKDPREEPPVANNIYFGVAPPEGETHTYQFTIFALDLPEDYFKIDIYDRAKYPPQNQEDARQKLGNHILASAFIQATFTSR